MRILQLTPGTGSFYCGSCLRDAALVRALCARGHDATIAPLYLPFALEREDAVTSAAPVRMGGINVYLQQKVPLLRWLPRPLVHWLDRPGLLRWAAKRGNMTEARDLGEMTVSMLRGEEGRQRAEVKRLVTDLAHEPPPEIVLLSNVMLAGLVHPLREALGVPIAVSLQGEQPFLDGLPEPFRARAWNELRERCREVDVFLAVSRYTADLMTERLALPADKVYVVHNGIELTDFVAEPGEPVAPPTIGYLARMCPDKGLPLLVEAFLHLKRAGTVPDLRLRVCGVMLGEDRAGVDALRAEVERAGFGADLDVLPNVEREEKIAFLRTLDVLSVPAGYGESFGLYLLEAMAAGVPVVQPRCAAFPEVLEATGGGVLCEVGDPASLAQELERLLLEPDRARALGQRGRAAVQERFSSDAMAAGVERVLAGVLAASRG